MLFNMKYKDKGFTLIELLVVISIIAVLMSIMMPALQNARGQAQKIACSASMRQLGQAALAFAVDNDDYLPMANANSLNNVGVDGGCPECVSHGRRYPHKSWWYVDIAPYLGLRDHEYIVEAQKNYGGWYRCEILGIDAPGVFVCPSRKRSVHNGVRSLSYGWNWWGLGYRCTQNNQDIPRYWAPYRASTISSASITGMIGENPLGVSPALEELSPRHYWGGDIWDGGVVGGSGTYYYYGDRHKPTSNFIESDGTVTKRGGSHYVAVDGHIEYRTYTEYVEDFVYYRHENRTGGGSIIFPNPRRWK